MGDLGPYELLGEIGRGATGVVWRAWDRSLEREVAIKEPILPVGLKPEAREEYLERFARECKTIGSLNHPNIVTVFDAGVFDGRPAAVMELIEGDTLAHLLSQGPLPHDRAVDFAVQVLAGLSYAHSRNIIHRDLKPANVFVTPAGRVKLMDFGIAGAPAEVMRNRTGGAIGSPGYLAPEQIRGGAADARGDVFAAGVLLYEMLTARNPFEAGNPILTIENTLSLPVPHVNLPGLPARVNETIAIATAKDPQYRYASASEMATALAGAPAQPAVARAGGVPKPVWFGIGAVAAVGAIGAVVLLATSGTPSPLSGSMVVVPGQTAGATGGSGATGALPTGAAQPAAPTAAELASVRERELDARLREEFQRVESWGEPWDLSGVQSTQDNGGRWWGIGARWVTTYDFVDAWALMVNDGNGWQVYGMVYDIYGLEWEGSPYEQIPPEVKSVLFADVPEVYY